MRAKICGITNIQDALDAISAGADALGFVFYEPSPRYIKPDTAKEIVKQLPPFVQSVGLFVNEESFTIDTICKQVGLDRAQVITQDANSLKRLQTKYIEVVRVKSAQDLTRLQSSQYYLVDAFVPEYGGKGKRIALEWFKGIDCSYLILAGGLSSENLCELRGYGFYGVDVSSAVEQEKGKKDFQKMQEFITIAKSL